MSDSNTVDVTDDLDAFSAELFKTPAALDDADQVVDEGEGESEEATETPSATEEVEESVAPEEEANDEEDALAHEDDDDTEDEEEDRSLFKTKGRKPARERINELTARAREAERRAEALLRELEEARSKREPEDKPTQEAKSSTAPLEGAPDPEAEDKDGNPVYPLGEFDPHYIRDLTKFTIKQETAAAKAAEAEARQREALEQAENELVETWTEKLKESAERLPDLSQKAVGLEETFRDLDPNYGKYLASTIMALEYGPDVLDYLADNIAEAQKIVASGPTQATIALGRLEARFAFKNEKRDEVEKGRIVKPTSAPTPPPTNRGSAGKKGVSADTDDLDAFERHFFVPKRL